jgi:hypothetical protein
MRKPSPEELPPGYVRDFVDLLFYFYQAAHRPTLRQISDRIRNDDLPGTASTETIRKMLHGTTVPANWETVTAVLQALTAMAGRDPDAHMRWDGKEGSSFWLLENLWHRALDEPDMFYVSPDDPPF